MKAALFDSCGVKKTLSFLTVIWYNNANTDWGGDRE
jgi:hypothetical protein